MPVELSRIRFKVFLQSVMNLITNQQKRRTGQF